MLERDYQAELKSKLRDLFPGCYILKNDPEYFHGIPDLLVLYRDRWAMLEVKRSATSRRRPNQQLHVDVLNEMSYAAVIYPENEEDILRELQETFVQPRRNTRIVWRK
jgi:hypothetical protein